MKKFSVFLAAAFLVLVSAARSDLVTQVKAYMVENGLDPDTFGVRGAPAQIVYKDGEPELVWDVARLRNIPKPEEADFPEDPDAVLEAYYAAKEDARQAAKPVEQRVYENLFFDVSEQLFNLTGVTNAVTPKLGFPELQGMVEAVQAVDPMAAVNLSLQLLTIDAALKRHNPLWWEDAAVHPELQEPDPE